MEDRIKKFLEQYSEEIGENGDSPEAISNAVLQMIEDLGNREATELEKYGVVAKVEKEISRQSRRGSTHMATDGKSIVMSNNEALKTPNTGGNHQREVAILVSELGEITNVGLSYTKWENSTWNRTDIRTIPPFKEIFAVAIEKAKRVIKVEEANFVMKMVYRIRDSIGNKNTKMLDDGKMTVPEIQGVLNSLKAQKKQDDNEKRKQFQKAQAEKSAEFRNSIKAEPPQERIEKTDTKPDPHEL